MARDRYTLDVICPNCGNSGQVRVSEDDDYPYVRDPGFRIDELPPGFSVVKASVYRQQTQLSCRCGQVMGV